MAAATSVCGRAIKWAVPLLAVRSSCGCTQRGVKEFGWACEPHRCWRGTSRVGKLGFVTLRQRRMTPKRNTRLPSACARVKEWGKTSRQHRSELRERFPKAGGRPTNRMCHLRSRLYYMPVKPHSSRGSLSTFPKTPSVPCSPPCLPQRILWRGRYHRNERFMSDAPSSR